MVGVKRNRSKRKESSDVTMIEMERKLANALIDQMRGELIELEQQLVEAKQQIVTLQQRVTL